VAGEGETEPSKPAIAHAINLSHPDRFGLCEPDSDAPEKSFEM